MSTPPHLNLCTPGQRQVEKALKYNDKQDNFENSNKIIIWNEIMLTMINNDCNEYEEYE